jgi:transposase
MERLRLIKAQIKAIDAARVEWLKTSPRQGAAAMVSLLAQVYGLGLETAAVLVHEVFSRDLRDRRAVARYGGLTGSPDESGSRRRGKGLSKSGNPRVRRVMIQLSWRFTRFQKDSALAQWWRTQTEGGRKRTVMIVALARKLLIALWRMVNQGLVPEGLVLRPQS